MDSFNPTVLFQIAIWLIPAVFAIVVHEYAHGWVAMKLGDTTARDAGRLSLNPLQHVDPVGTLLVPGLLLLLKVPFVFGWAKPVPVNFSRLRHLRLGTFLVALAGPVANVFMALGWWGVYRMVAGGQGIVSVVLELMAVAGMAVNVALILFNLVPLPPLDGGRIVGSLLPDVLARPYMKLEPYGIFILLFLIATGAFSHVFEPLFAFFVSWL